MVGHGVRPAHRAKINGVVLDQGVEPIVRQHLAVAGVVVAAGEVEVVELHVYAEPARGGVHHAQALRHHFSADAIAGNDCDLVFAHVSRAR